MKSLTVTTIFLLINYSTFSQISFDEWKKESETNKRLLPCYGHLPKTEKELQADSAYITQILALPQFKKNREASDHMIALGFQYYYRQDFKTAMYRFNQAYLLDSTNTDIYWGFGAVYMALNRPDLAEKQYKDGLSLNPDNTHLMTDLATIFLGQYYIIQEMPKSDIVKNPDELAKMNMDSAIYYLTKSYKLDPKDVNTTFKLSICYWNINDCDNAWKYYNECKALGGQPITEEYTRDLEKRCKK